MTVVEVAGLRFGEGLPKICVPLTGGNMPALLRETQLTRSLPADLFEWRVDGYFGSAAEALAMLGQELGSKPLLCTLRTQAEGGRAALAPDQAERQLEELLDLGGFQLLDVELSLGEERVRRLLEKARDKGIGGVVSRHDLAGTPPRAEMAATLERMKALGADLPKLAVTPHSPGDVLELLAATWEASGRIGPVITMAMGGLGKVSRVSGEVFGSCVTFGAGERASAPGQLNAEDLRAILEDLTP